MLAKEEYRIAYHNDRKLILCERLDMLGGMEEELLQGTFFAYKCPPEKESALKWKKMFEEFTKRSFVVVSSKQRNGRQTVFMGKLRCVHRRNYRSYRKAPASKRDFGCKAGLNIHVRALESKRSKNPTAGGYNLRVKSVPHAHNHSLDVALKFRRCGDTTKAMLTELFDLYHTPASATELLKLRLLEQHGDDYLSEVADRAVLPDKAYVTRMYYETYRGRYGNMSRKEVRKLQENAAMKRLRFGPEHSEQTRASSTSADQPSHIVKEEDKNDGGDDFMDAFDAPGDLPPGWISAPQICYDEPPVSGEVGLEQSIAVGGSDVVTAAMASVEDRPASSPEHVIVCYVDDDPEDSASAMLVDSTYSESLNQARAMDAADDILVGAADIEADMSVAAEAVIGSVSMTVPHAGLLTTVSGIGSSPPALDTALQPPLPPPPLLLPVATDPAAAAPSAEAVSREVSKWASELCRQLATDAGGQWRDAAATFVQNWELLPTPGRLTALSQFGRLTGLGRPAGSAKPQTARPTETAATQTESEEPDAKSEPETSSEPETALPYSQSLCVLRSGCESGSAVPLDWVWTGSGLTARPAGADSWGERQSSSSLPTARPSMKTRLPSARTRSQPWPVYAPDQHLRRRPSGLRSGRREDPGG